MAYAMAMATPMAMPMLCYAKGMAMPMRMAYAYGYVMTMIGQYEFNDETSYLPVPTQDNLSHINATCSGESPISCRGGENCHIFDDIV